MSRNYNPLRVAGNDLVLVTGSFVPVTTPTVPTLITNGRELASITHPSAGLYKLTFVEYYQGICSTFASIFLNAPADVTFAFSAYVQGQPELRVPASCTLTLLAGSTPVDPAGALLTFGFLFFTTTLFTTRGLGG